nr:MAG TPA: hypothetical protein [Bacteriophage sp.]
MKHINLETFANGAFTAQVNRAIEEVTKNIQDPNTEPGATRKITVTIGFKPNQERNFVATGVQTKTTLAPALGAVTALSMGKDIKTGQVEAVEVNTGQIPGQMSIADTPGVQLSENDTEKVAEINGKTVDTTTGEIIMEQENKVIDLRAKQA